MTNTDLEVLDLFGFVVAHKKTIRCQQAIEFLGVQFDSVIGTVACYRWGGHSAQLVITGHRSRITDR